MYRRNLSLVQAGYFQGFGSDVRTQAFLFEVKLLLQLERSARNICDASGWNSEASEEPSGTSSIRTEGTPSGGNENAVNHQDLSYRRK